MTVSITWSSTTGGAAITTPLDHGSATNDASTTAQTIYLRHDGGSEITNASLYFRQISGTYTGSFSAASDYAEILAWGNETAEDDFGGVLVSWDSTEWSTYSAKTGTDFFVLSTGYGNGEDNEVVVPVTVTATPSSLSTAGSIPSGTEISFQIKFQVPANEDTVGIRQIESVLTYTYTS